MSISGISTYDSSIGSTTSLASLLAQNSTDTDTTVSDSDSSSPSSSTTISGPAQMLSKLKKLEETDPDKFKKIMSDMADKLNALAKAQGDTDGSSKLSQLADKFEKAGETGDLSSLQPPPPPPASDAAQSAALSAYGQSSSQNQDLASLLTSSSSATSSDSDGSSVGDDSAANSAATSAVSGKHHHHSHDQAGALFQQFNQEVTAALQ